MNSLKNLTEKIKQTQINELPGAVAQYKMAPIHREKFNLDEHEVKKYKQSAVMILLCEGKHGNIFIPLIKRKDYEGMHSGQISFPGGKFDDKDKTLVNTAHRECFEEIGISDIETLLLLTPLQIPVSQFFVQPVLGICSTKNTDFIGNSREVEQILKLNLNDLLMEREIKHHEFGSFNNSKIIAPFFELENHKIWGATAMILSELKVLVKSIW